VHRSLSETVLRNVRIIAIDQEIVQGAPANNTAAGKVTHTVSLQLAPEQVNKITVAKELGKLSLAIRAAVEQQDTGDTGTMFSCDASPEIARQGAIARQSATVAVHAGGKVKEYPVKKYDSGDTGTMVGCDGSPESARGSPMVGYAGDKGKEYAGKFFGGEYAVKFFGRKSDER
jgi:pilus assembly protein CpaB